MEKFLKEYLNSEMREMMAEVGTLLGQECPPDSSDFNLSAIAWIQKNAAEFRVRWNKLHSMNELSELN